MTGIDTNILMYACDKGSGAKQTRALEVISESADGVLLWQVACEFIAATRKLTEQGFSPEAAWAPLDDFLAVFPLVLPTQGALERAKDLHANRQVAFWDALIFGACLECGITRLYSEDLPGGIVPGLDVVNPFT